MKYVQTINSRNIAVNQSDYEMTLHMSEDEMSRHGQFATNI